METTKLQQTPTNGETIEKRNYFIFGHNISHSLSPTLHNAGFQHLSLPHHYTIHESPSVDQTIAHILSTPDFGGASVTFPHKLQIAQLLDSTSPSAQKVGAVNTVIARGTGASRTLHGENTDWIGIKRCIERSQLADLHSSAALVLGAGGAARAACYALQELGVASVAIVNRTLSGAEDMASQFPQVNTHCFSSLDEAVQATQTPLRIIVACIPADDLTKNLIPTGLFSGAAHGVLVEMAYRPQVTGMMEAAAEHGGWAVCRGIDVLEEQAYEQFQMWTGREAPVEVMRGAMRAKVEAKS